MRRTLVIFPKEWGYPAVTAVCNNKWTDHLIRIINIGFWELSTESFSNLHTQFTMAPSTSGLQTAPINLYNTSLLKSTSDDQLSAVLSSLDYAPDHHLVDVRLALGYASVLVAGLTAYWDYRVGFFEAQYPWTVLGLVLYLGLNLAYTLWIWKVEAGIVYYGKKSDSTTVAITSSKGSKTSKLDPLYTVSVKVSSPKVPAGAVVASKTGGYESWFATNGLIDYEKFAAWVSGAVTEAESKLAATASKKKK